MSYKVRLKNAEPFEDQTIETAYKILDNGVLQLLGLADGDDWEISVEYSPTSWESVEGTRFDKETAHLKGDGKVVNGAYMA